MWPFDKARKTREASGLTGLERPDLGHFFDILNNQEQKIVHLELRVAGLEQAVIELCKGLKYHLDRIDANTQQLDKNMHNIAAMTIRPPKDLLNGGSEPN